MRCKELESCLEAYARGTMGPEDVAAFEAHLHDCEECSRIVALAEPELHETNSLPRSVAPVQDLWPGIQRRIEVRRTPGRVRVPGWALAAAAVLLVVVSSGATALLLQRFTAPAVQPSGRVVALEAEYAAASQELAVALDQARGRLSPKTLATIERNLAVIDAALAESRWALARDPGSIALEQLVVAAWRQKVDLLRRAIAIGGAS